jgi:hypothetical protein
MIRDRDRIHGDIVTRRLRAMGIRDKPTAPVLPWQNGFDERLIGSIRRECLDTARPICALSLTAPALRRTTRQTHLPPMRPFFEVTVGHPKHPGQAR